MLAQLSKALESLPKEQRETVMRIFYAVEQSSFQGPLPPPEMLKGYESVLPGSAERLLSMAENQMKHRIGMESSALDSQMKMSRKGQVLGFVIVLLLEGIAFWLGMNGHDWLAGVIGCTTVIALAIVFVLRKIPKGRKNA